MNIELDGHKIKSVDDFHTEMSRLLDFGPYYGRNLNALWDRISRDVERPLHLTWTHARVSREAMGRATFTEIEKILRLAEEEDRQLGMAKRFELTIVD